MTGYVSSAPFAGCFHLWADTPDEAAGLAWAVSDAPQQTELGYLLTQNEMVSTLQYGALITDWLGPARWLQEGKRGRAVCDGPYKGFRP